MKASIEIRRVIIIKKWKELEQLHHHQQQQQQQQHQNRSKELDCSRNLRILVPNAVAESRIKGVRTTAVVP